MRRPEETPLPTFQSQTPHTQSQSEDNSASEVSGVKFGGKPVFFSKKAVPKDD